MKDASPDVRLPVQVSVIMPVHNGAALLNDTLTALNASDMARGAWELIVVDDASTDATSSMAALLADRVVALTAAPSGPAFARNRGAQVARGDVLVFIDADVVVNPDTIRRLCALLQSRPDVAAVFGAYDTHPAGRGIVSRYRNLMHHYVHSQNAGDAETFWAGCGAVRRSVFMDVGGYNEQRYRRPQIEDIELGHRIRDLGHRIVLDPSIQCTHLKQWTLASMVRADVNDRAVPWVELLLEEGRRNPARSTTLNVRTSEKLFTLLTGLALATFAAAVIVRDVRWVAIAGLLVCPVLMANGPFFLWLWKQDGAATAIAAIPLRLLHYVISGLSVVIGTTRWLVRRRLLQSTPSRSAIASGPKSSQVLK